MSHNCRHSISFFIYHIFRSHKKPAVCPITLLLFCCCCPFCVVFAPCFSILSDSMCVLLFKFKFRMREKNMKKNYNKKLMLVGICCRICHFVDRCNIFFSVCLFLSHFFLHFWFKMLSVIELVFSI